jgi:hypothetical protein
MQVVDHNNLAYRQSRAALWNAQRHSACEDIQTPLGNLRK